MRRRAPGSTRAPDRGRPQDTRERILDVAESLFAETGFAATSLRTITSRAGVNLAAVNYHFGSKEALVEAVFSRRLAPLNRQRVDALSVLEAAAGGAPLALRDILRAFVNSAFHRPDSEAAGWVIFLRLLGRAFTEPTEAVRSVLQRQYREMAQRYKCALARALPDLAETELAWRMQFMFGTVSYVMAGGDTLACVGSCRLDDANDLDVVAERLVGFLEAGLSAPVPSRTAPKRGRSESARADASRSAS